MNRKLPYLLRVNPNFSEEHLQGRRLRKADLEDGSGMFFPKSRNAPELHRTLNGNNTFLYILFRILEIVVMEFHSLFLHTKNLLNNVSCLGKFYFKLFMFIDPVPTEKLNYIHDTNCMKLNASTFVRLGVCRPELYSTVTILWLACLQLNPK
jgi:hypothetical protein